MKVGIASCYYHHNYGSMLQAYATQRIIEKLGCEAYTISCTAPIEYMTQSKLSYYWHKITNIGIIRTKIRQLKSKMLLKKYPDVLQGRAVRDKFFDDFHKKYIRLTGYNRTRKDLEQTAATFDAIVVGSDMLWHPINVEHDYYTLTFVPDGIKKISYATSFGTTNIPKYQIKIYKDFLKKFDSISVREKSGIQVVASLKIGKTARVVLDPTLLFTGEEWMEIQDSEPIVKEKYIFCYFLGVNQEHRDFVRRLQCKTGYEVVALQHLDEFIEADIDFGDKKPFNVGPSEFINLIRNAEYVCTDSFHGTCFSILNHKQFYTFNRYAPKSSQSTNTRIDSLLGIVGLENRRMSSKEDYERGIEFIGDAIDYTMVDNKLCIAREKSVKYLKDALLGGN